MKTTRSIPSGLLSHKVSRRVSLIAVTGLSILMIGASYAETDTLSERSDATNVGFDQLQSLELEKLASIKGKDGNIVHLNNVQSIQEMEATVSNPNFTVVGGDMGTGNVTFGDNALGSFSGTGIFNAVSGNGNAVNNAIGISVYIAN